MADEKKTRTAKGPEVQDVSKVLEQASKTIIDLDQRLMNMRQELDALSQSAGLPLPSPRGGPFQVAPPGGPTGAMPPMFTALGMGGAWPPTETSMPPMAPAPFFAQAPGGPFGATWSSRQLRERPPAAREPQADIVDAGEEFLIQMEVPGVKKDDLDIMATERGLLITGEYRPDLDDEGVVVVCERGPIAYRRTVQLPSPIQTDGCKATLKDGLLTLRVPKRSPSDGAHHVNVAYT